MCCNTMSLCRLTNDKTSRAMKLLLSSWREWVQQLGVYLVQLDTRLRKQGRAGARSRLTLSSAQYRQLLTTIRRRAASLPANISWTVRASAAAHGNSQDTVSRWHVKDLHDLPDHVAGSACRHQYLGQLQYHSETTATIREESNMNKLIIIGNLTRDRSVTRHQAASTSAIFRWRSTVGAVNMKRPTTSA